MNAYEQPTLFEIPTRTDVWVFVDFAAPKGYAGGICPHRPPEMDPCIPCELRVEEMFAHMDDEYFR